MREHVLRCSGTVYRYSYERDDQPRIVRILQFCFFTPQGGDGGDEEGGGGRGREKRARHPAVREVWGGLTGTQVTRRRSY